MVLVLLVALCAFPAVAAAADPLLTATTVPGREIDLSGSGFPADADVLLAIQRNSADDGTQTAHTDATGSFSATIDAGPGRGGSYLVVATSGTTKAVVEVVAVETAGADGGVRPSPPDTAVASSAPGPSDTPGGGLSLVAAAIAIGVAIFTSLTFAWRRTGTAQPDEPR